LHNDGPNVYAYVKDNDNEETHLRAATLAKSLHVEDETQTEAADDAEEG
jgi:hypothetical protein